MARLFGFVGNRADLGGRVLELESKPLKVVAKGTTLEHWFELLPEKFTLSQLLAPAIAATGARSLLSTARSMLSGSRDSRS